MDAPYSELARRIDLKYKEKIREYNIHNKSLIGEVFIIDGKEYVYTDGEIDINETINEIKRIVTKLNIMINKRKKPNWYYIIRSLIKIIDAMVSLSTLGFYWSSLELKFAIWYLSAKNK